MVFRMGIHREIETVVSIGLTMLAGIALVALSLEVMLPVTAHADPVAREDIALALSVVLIGLLMMVTRRNAVSQVVGFMSLENGINLAATGAQGMPLVVEISVAFSILIAFIVDRHLPVPHPRAVRHGRRRRAGPRSAADSDELAAMSTIRRRCDVAGHDPADAAAAAASWRSLPGYRLRRGTERRRQPGVAAFARLLLLVSARHRTATCWSTTSTSSSSC